MISKMNEAIFGNKIVACYGNVVYVFDIQAWETGVNEAKNVSLQNNERALFASVLHVHRSAGTQYSCWCTIMNDWVVKPDEFLIEELVNAADEMLARQNIDSRTKAFFRYVVAEES